MALDSPHPVNSLGFAKPPSQTRVVVAMSGGVDSSVVAALLADQGYDVVGVTLQLYDHGAALAKKGACCAGVDIHDARRVAEERGFPHYVLDYENIFKDAVIDEFADSYLAGATPVPCIRCNERVKFKDLLQTAKDLEADCMATGHYIQRLVGENGPELHSATDAARDQSYFLWGLDQDALSKTLFPLGKYEKTQIRDITKKMNLKTAKKPESRENCFIADDNYHRFLKEWEEKRGRQFESGEIVNELGETLGKHQGTVFYTIGQRRGLGISNPTPLSCTLNMILAPCCSRIIEISEACAYLMMLFKLS